MPLIQGRSKKSFDKNVETEMQDGKPQDQSLAIAYSVKRKAKKKMAEGGMAYRNDSAKTESRPTPSQVDNDQNSVTHNSARKQLTESTWIDNPTVAQATRPSLTPLKRPKMVGSDAFSVRDRGDIESDLRRMSSEPPAPPTEEPSSKRDEDEADKSGPDTPSLHMKKMASGGQIEKPKTEDVEVIPDKGFGKIIRVGMAEGGMAHEMDDQDESEVEEMRHASIAAAIMARKAKKASDSDSDIDDAMMMAEGGEVDIMSNGREHENAYYGRNEDEVLKENYMDDMEDVSQPDDSNETGDSREDSTSDPRDRVDSIRRAMMKRRSK